MAKQLNKEGYNIGRYRVRRLMEKLKMKARTPKRYKVTTDSKHSYSVAANLVNRQFDAEAPNRIWTTECVQWKAGCIWLWFWTFFRIKSSAGPWTSI